MSSHPAHHFSNQAKLGQALFARLGMAFMLLCIGGLPHIAAAEKVVVIPLFGDAAASASATTYGYYDSANTRIGAVNGDSAIMLATEGGSRDGDLYGLKFAATSVVTQGTVYYTGADCTGIAYRRYSTTPGNVQAFERSLVGFDPAGGPWALNTSIASSNFRVFIIKDPATYVSRTAQSQISFDASDVSYKCTATTGTVSNALDLEMVNTTIGSLVPPFEVKAD